MRAGSGARQLAAPQATASASTFQNEKPRAVAKANPASAESPLPTVDVACRGAVHACTAEGSLLRTATIPRSPRLMAAERAPSCSKRRAAFAADAGSLIVIWVTN